MIRSARGVLLLAALLGMSICVSGCLSIPKAAKVEVQVQDGSVTLYKPVGGLQRGGETVLKIDNYATHSVNMVLAETNAPLDRLPAKLVDATSGRDDSQIVGMTSRLDKAGTVYQYGAIPQPSPKVATLHVYLKPGKRYVLFDKLGGYANGMAIVLTVPRSK